MFGEIKMFIRISNLVARYEVQMSWLLSLQFCAQCAVLNEFVHL